MASSIGSSFRHGGHHDAHTSSSTTLPRNDDSARDLPSRPFDHQVGRGLADVTAAR